MNNTYTRGFTLIELLVVIAIIGILASVVLASLNSARDKGTNASYKSTLNNMRAQAELYYDSNGTTRGYTGVCTAVDTDNGTGYSATTMDDTIASALSNANSASCGSTATSYVMAVNMVNDGGNVYCVDSTGVSRTGTVTGGTTNAAQEIADGNCDGN